MTQGHRSRGRGRISVAATAVLALLAALIPGALFASVQAYTPPGNKIQFTFEGCRNNGDIVLPIDFGPAGQKYACLDPVYTTGNLGKGWNELDLVPHRLITTNSAGTASTFNVIVAADNVNNGKVGYDVISEPEIFRDSAAGCQVTSGPEAYENGVTGGAELAEWAARHTSQQVADQLQAAGVAAGPMYRPEEVYEHPQLRLRKVLADMAHPLFEVPLPAETGPAPFRNIPHSPQRPAPLPGADTRRVCAGVLGMTPDETEHLIAEKVLFATVSAEGVPL